MNLSVGSSNPMVLASVFALAWFITGVVAGAVWRERRTVRPGAPGGRSRRERIEIYAGNLPYDVTRKDLAKLFGAYGEVVSARVIQNRLSGKSRGYGFLEMSDRAEAAAAVQAMNGKELKGRKLVVNEAKANNRRQRRGGR